LIGFKTEQLFLVAFFNILYYASPGTRKFITGFSIFILYWIVFDFMKAFPNYRYNTVHIESLYRAEKYLFGIHQGGQIITPNEFWLQHQSVLLDTMSGFFYLCWVPVPLLFAGYLFYKNREQFLQFSLTFFLVNMLGFVVYYVYPAAPPWYVQQYGFAFNPFTPGNTAGLQRFDNFFQVHVFQGLYAKSSNVFAAMPSLHASYMAIVVYYCLKNRMYVLGTIASFIMLGIWFAAVYTSHHYILDVLAGIVCAIAGIALFRTLIRRNGRMGAAFAALLYKIA
jgi:membrane-associated phospholipid phosphatase